MGKPRMILLIRHAQSEGNMQKAIHQIVPDHRVKLTEEGKLQAADAGRRLRAMLKPTDTIRVYTSPYRRTRETTAGLLDTLTEATEDGPSPFSRDSIIVREEPRLREQDFGNFQPCSAEMERMWSERADYGHFFYRIPNGESAADAYDRVSGVIDSLWRSFEEVDSPSVLVLVTHGLMTRVFLMRWFHYTVERFEDLRNINHCEFVIMNRTPDTGKYILENKLRTWSELKRKATLSNKDRRQSSSAQKTQSPVVALRQWGGCVNGCDHGKAPIVRRPRTHSKDSIIAWNQTSKPNSPAIPAMQNSKAVSTALNGIQNQATSAISPSTVPISTIAQTQPGSVVDEALRQNDIEQGDKPPGSSTTPEALVDQDIPAVKEPKSRANRPGQLEMPILPRYPSHLRGRDFGGTLSGMPTPDTDRFSTDQDDSDSSANKDTTQAPADYLGIKTLPRQTSHDDHDEPETPHEPSTISPRSNSRRRSQTAQKRQQPRRQPTREDMENWMAQSGMGRGTRADALGDEGETSDEEQSEDASGSEHGNGMGHSGTLQGVEEVDSEEELPPNADLKSVKEAEKKDKSLRGSVY